MGNIVILDENTANKIAAGEVIERPASVVKELVENSIDAGADNINIEIKNGGITFIKITDNGSGIREDDAVIAFERHATSKIRSADDLEHVLTMGFRGEALASIAAVADVKVTTRVRESEQGTLVEMRGGHTIDVRRTGCPVGTTITIKDLFFNTPARFKFLKKDTTEAGYISEAISRTALGNPGISFKLSAGGSQVLYTPGNNDQLSAIFSIYGKDTAKSVYEINYSDEKVKITGYAGKPEIARSNRSHQYVYINRRFIKSKIIIAAVDEAYNTFLMKNKFPFVLINVEINPMMVDVNVHPTKMEVKFSNEQDIFRAVYNAVNNALLGSSEIRRAVINEKPVKNPFKIENTDKAAESFSQQSIRFTSSTGTEEKAVRPADSIVKNEYKINETVYRPERTNTETMAEGTSEAVSEIVRIIPDITTVNNAQAIYELAAKSKYADTQVVSAKMQEYQYIQTSTATLETKETSHSATDNKLAATETYKESAIEEPAKEESVVQPIEKKDLFEGAKIVGQIFSTYIILEQKGQMVLIDQHAAHERIMYEELKERFEKMEPMSQMLLDTIVVELTHQEIKLLEDEKELFYRLGFEFDEFGSNSIILRAVPFSSLGHNSKEVFTEVLDRMLGKAKNERTTDVSHTLYTIACKAAVKANKKLDEAEMQSVLEKLSKLDNPYTCPHGRPSSVIITKYEMEKMFKRIV